MELKPLKINPTLTNRKLVEIIRAKLSNYKDENHFNIVDGYRRDLIVMFETVQHRKEIFTYLYNNHTDLHVRTKEDNVPCVLGLISLQIFPNKEYIDNLIDTLRIEYYYK